MTTDGATEPFLAPLLRFERETPNERWLTQPLPGGAVRTFTFAEAIDEARRVASWIRSLGLPEGSHIALLSKNTAWWILADLAIWMAGHVSVPIYPTLSATGVRRILDHSEARLVFVGKLDDWQRMKAGVPQHLPILALPLCVDDTAPTWADVVRTVAPIRDVALGEGHRCATIVYTSGSTGEEKGVMLTFATMRFAAQSAATVFELRKPRDRMLSYLPLAHVMERCCVECGALHYGTEIFFAESLETFAQDLRRARPTVFVSVPRLWLKFQAGVHAQIAPEKLRRLLRIPILATLVKRRLKRALGLDHVRVAFSGAAPLPASVLEWYRGLGLELLEAYGMSENFCISHITKPGRVRAGYVGEPWPGVACRIASDGEVQMRGPALMSGYFKAPELTKHAFTEDGYLRTGDCGEIDDAGRLKITGRTKDLFKTSGGKYVAPQPIENLLLQNEFLESGCVLGAGRAHPCAVVSLADAFRANGLDDRARRTIADSLARSLTTVNASLEKHEVLRQIVIAKEPWTIDAGLLTPTMKVKRAAIEDRYAPSLDAWYRSPDEVVWE